MNSANHEKALAQKAMDNLLVDLLCREQAFEAVRVTRITRLHGGRPCWHLWTEDNQGVYQVELQDVGQVFCGSTAVIKPFLEMEADFIIRYIPFAETETDSQEPHIFLTQDTVANLPGAKSIDTGGPARKSALPGMRMRGSAGK